MSYPGYPGGGYPPQYPNQGYPQQGYQQNYPQQNYQPPQQYTGPARPATINPAQMGNVMNDYQGGQNAALQHQRSDMGAMHSYSNEEVRGFSDYINRNLASDSDLHGEVPLDLHGGIFRCASKGVLLCKMLNMVAPGCVDMRKVATRNPNPFQITANHNLAIQAAKNLGLSVVNIGPTDLSNGTPHLILGLMWQIIRKGLMDKINVDLHPEMMALLDKTRNETVETFVNLPPEQVLLRWFNFHLKKAGHPRTVNNFSSDIQDAQNYLVLLSQLAPQLVNPQEAHFPDVQQRAERVIQVADQLGCKEFVTAPEDILTVCFRLMSQGNPKLNLAFVATLFNKNPTMQAAVDDEDVYRRALSEAEALMKQKLAEEMDDRKKRWAEEEAQRRAQWEAEEGAKRRQMEEEERARRGQLQREETQRLQALAEQERLAQQKRLEEEEKRRREWEEEQRRLQEAMAKEAEERERQRLEAEARQREEWERQRRAHEAAQKKFQEDQAAAALQTQQQQQMLQQQQMAAQQAQLQAQQYAYMQQYYMQQQMMVQQQQPTTYATQSVGISFPIPKLTVTALRGSGLPQRLLGLDPYCKISHKGGKQKTFFAPSTTNPVWNQDFDFMNFGKNDELIVQIWARRKLAKNEFLGEAIVSGEDIVLGEKNFQLKPRRGFPDQVTGNVSLRFSAKQY